ncbi:MAG: hypothetical protein EPN39_12545 [Chitinophagaceae bacterium]|nr:MAG: hypothetical protein EPN39_12545 [Chitinophagaceae bacterium]
MDQPTHIIQKQVFDIDFTSKEKAFELQTKISSLFYSQLENTIGTVFDKFIRDDRILSIETLRVDIGRIPYDSIEDSFADRLKEALEKELETWFYSLNHYADSHENNHLSSLKSSYAGLLEYFLITGTLPWWASGNMMTDPAKVIKLLLEENAQAVKNLIHKAGQFADVRRRLIYQFSEEIIRSIVRILEPDEADFIFGYHREIVKIQHAQQIVKDEISVVKKEVWIFIVTYLLVDRGSNFNRKIFVKNTLRQMAEHYNLHYEEILKLFEAALNDKAALEESHHSLGILLKELFLEQFPLDSGNRDNEDKEKSISKKEIKVRKEEIIRYYLQFGTLPLWAEHIGAKELNIGFEELIRESPDIAKELILTLENKERAIQHITFAFDIPVITGIVKLVEPANATFIIHYVERVKKVQRKESFANAEEKSFTQSVWQFVLAYLLIDRGSVFNTRMFLESNIRRMAHQYNLHVETLLTFLIQEVKEADNMNNGVPLFLLLTDILHSHKGSMDEKSNIHSIVSGERDRATSEKRIKIAKQHSKTLFDILRYWVIHGHFPWWGKQYADQLPAEMWKELISTELGEALKLIQYAGTDPAMKQRLVYQLPLSIFLATFDSLPQGKEAIKMYEVMAYFLGNLAALRIKNKLVQQNILLLAWWDIFISSGYQAFDPEQFINVSIYRLSQWTGLYVENIRHRLLAISHHDMDWALPEKLKPVFQQLVKALNSPSTTIDERREDYGWPDFKIVISQYIAPEKGKKEVDILGESLRILEYYLTWNKLPDQIPGLTPAQTDHFLKRLLQLLMQERPVALRTILQKQTHSSAARMKMHNLFALNTDGSNKNIEHILQEFRQRDFLQYLTETSGKGLEMDDKNMREILSHAVYHSFTGKEKGFLQVLLRSPAMIRYIAEEFGNDELYRLIGNITPNGKEQVAPFLKQVYNFLLPAVPDTLERGKMGLLFRQFSLYYFAEGSNTKDLLQYLTLLFTMLADAMPDKIKFYKSLLKVINTESNAIAFLPYHFIPVLKRQLEQLIAQETRQDDFKHALVETDQIMSNQISRVDFKQVENKTPIGRPTNPPEQPRKKEESKKDLKKLFNIKEDTIYISNAGLVLFHPFLSTYFNRLGLMEKGKFVNEEAIIRGVYLLQFLVDGKEQHPEHELVLNKILCGMPVEKPMPAEVAFGEQDKEISMELLNVMKERWEKVKDTSVEGFRASFLQRNGALTATEDSWNLRVEQRGYDVLLQTLPWSFSMIKASWMEKILYVEWA